MHQFLEVVGIMDAQGVGADARGASGVAAQDGGSLWAAGADLARILFRGLPDLAWLKDPQGRYLSCNAAFERIVGCSEAELRGRTDVDVFSAEEAAFFRSNDRGALERDGLHVNEEWLTFRDTGERRRYEVLKTPLRGQDEVLIGVLGVARDITRQHHQDEALRLAARIFESVGESILVTDAAGDIVAVNAAFSRISGYPAQEVIGRNPRLLRSGRQGPAFAARMWRQLAVHDRFQGEFWNRARDGRLYPLLQTITVLRDEVGRITHYVGVGADLSRLHEAEQRSHHLRLHDTLTDLPNRQVIATRLHEAIETRRGSDRSGGVTLLVIGLDGFKSINDSLGHAAGDRVLVEMAERLRVLAGGQSFVGRLGGDEFVVMRVDAGLERVQAEARDWLAALAEPIELQGHAVTITVSIGLGHFPEDGDSADTLLRHAESALRGAKGEGRNTLRRYDPLQHQASLERLLLLSSLRRAVPAGELHAWYQPKLDLHSRELVGAEALVRWLHPELGWVSPAQFIPVAEQTDLIVAIGERMLDTVAAQVARWHAQGRGWLPVAVNLGARHFADAGLPARLQALRERHGLPPGVLELEITESMLMTAGGAPEQRLAELRQAGVKLSIDDFGTGYSSLSYLKRLPVDTLKIDRSFVAAIESDRRDLSIATTIIALARGLGLTVVAEGVETEGQRELLEQEGCAQGQGWLFAHAMPPAEFETWWQVWAPSPGRQDHFDAEAAAGAAPNQLA
ncbi:two-component system, chemotaxis family, CheB/CheR fusion protein [Sphaerotilus natans]|nr:two-component system, chemotaxis family, CheB/CheR fusion protein [Sphaerotilus natans]